MNQLASCPSFEAAIFCQERSSGGAVSWVRGGKSCAEFSPIVRLYWRHVQPARSPELRFHDSLQAMRRARPGPHPDDARYVDHCRVPSLRRETPVPAGGNLPRPAFAPTCPATGSAEAQGLRSEMRRGMTRFPLQRLLDFRRGWRWWDPLDTEPRFACRCLNDAERGSSGGVVSSEFDVAEVVGSLLVVAQAVAGFPVRDESGERLERLLFEDLDLIFTGSEDSTERVPGPGAGRLQELIDLQPIEIFKYFTFVAAMAHNRQPPALCFPDGQERVLFRPGPRVSIYLSIV